VAARRQALEALAPAFERLTAEFRLEPGRLRYEGGPVSREELEARLPRDIERGTTSLGPHLDDVAIVAGERDLRSYGSQGEQRLAVLSLLLAEAAVLVERGGVPPLLLLDDVLSELDPERRVTLARVLPEGGQTLITSTSAGALPLDPDQLLEVSSGEVRAA
jgi:DNA replication and repair protein RecF